MNPKAPAGLREKNTPHVVLVAVLSSLGALLLALYLTPMFLFGIFGVGFFPIEPSVLSPGAVHGDLGITHLVAASRVHVGDLLLMWDEAAGRFFSHNVLSAEELFDGVRFVTAGVSQDLSGSSSSSGSFSFITERTQSIPVVLGTVPIWGDVVSVIYSPQFQVLFLVAGVVSLVVVWMRFRSSRREERHDASWNDD